MSIDTSGEYWVGTEATDIAELLYAVTSENYRADRIAVVRCACGGDRFTLEADTDEGCAQRMCVGCKSKHLICDSGDHWDEVDPGVIECPACAGDVFEMAVAFSHRDDGDVRWITIGARCVGCGVLGAPVDWKIDYGPTGHLYERV